MNVSSRIKFPKFSRLLLSFCLAAAICSVVSTVAAERANAEVTCAGLAAGIQNAHRAIREAEEQVRDIQLRIDTNLRLMLAERNIVLRRLNPRTGLMEETITDSLRELNNRQHRRVTRDLPAAQRNLANATGRLVRLEAQYRANGCGPPPNPPSDCSDALEDTQPLRIVRGGNQSQRNLAQVIEQLPGPSLLAQPVAATVRPDGVVVDGHGTPVTNPANPGQPLQVPLGGQSGYQAGMSVLVSFNQVQVDTGAGAGNSVTLAYITNPAGRPIRDVPQRPQPTEIPHARDVFPEGFILFMPLGGGLAPLEEGIEQLQNPIGRALEMLQQLMQGARVPATSRNDRGRGPGCHAEFALANGIKGVGTNCSRLAPRGDWEWRIYAKTGSDGRGVSTKWVEHLGSRGLWTGLAGVDVFLHQFKQEEVAAWSPIKLDDFRIGNADVKAKYVAAFEQWKTRLVPRGAHKGKIEHLVPNPYGGGSTQTRSTPRSGCRVEAPNDYKELNIPG